MLLILRWLYQNERPNYNFTVSRQLAPERCGTTNFPHFRTCKYPEKWINPTFHHTSSTSRHPKSGKSNLGMNIYNYIPIYMQCRIGSGYYNLIMQSATEMSGCENRLFLILALCVSGRLIPLAESGGKRVRNQKKIEFRTPPADRMRLLRPHPGRPHAPFATAPSRPTACASSQFIAAPQSNLWFVFYSK